MNKRIWGPVCGLSLLVSGATGNGPSKVDSGKFILMAQSALGANNALEVRLIWIPTQGWLPTGGVNLYRQKTGKPEELIAKQIKPADGFIKKETLDRLTNPTTLKSDSFNAGIQKILSSKSVFQGTKTDVQKWIQARTPPLEIRQLLYKSGSFANHLRALKPSSTDKGSPLTSRAHAIVQAMVNPDLAAKLGMSFSDSGVKEGDSTTYLIRGVDGSGQEDRNPLATYTIIPSSSSIKPPAPTDLDAFQLDQNTADLHWEPATSTDQANLGMLSYRIVRIDSANSSGVQANSSPVLLASQQTKAGDHIAVPTTFRDSKAHLGKVTYQVYTEDSFGRESSPAVVTLNMDDLRVPAAVTHVVARLDKPHYNPLQTVFSTSNTQLVHVYFVPQFYLSIQDLNLNQEFHVFRTDADLGPSSTSELTTQPIIGTSAPLSQLTLQDLIDLYGLTQVLNAGGQALLTVFRQTPQTQWLASNSSKTISQLSAGQGIKDLAKNVMVYDDANGISDHYYSYSVTAEFSQAKRQSLPKLSRAVGVPLLQAPPRPSAPQGTFAVASGNFGFMDSGATIPTTGPSNMIAGNSTLKALSSKVLPSTQKASIKKFLINPAHFPHASPGIQGGSVALTWQPVTQTNNMRYGIFRASASGMFLTANTGATATNGPGAGLRVPSLVAGKPSWQYYFDSPTIPPANWVKIGETSNTSFTDQTPRSHAQIFAYRITAINRWGVTSEVSSQLRVTLKATLPPSPPTLVAAGASDNGGVTLTWNPNGADEQVNKYVILRLPTMNALSQALGLNSPQSAPQALIKPRVDLTAQLGTRQIAVGKRATHSLQTMKKLNASLKVSEATILGDMIAQSNTTTKSTLGGGNRPAWSGQVKVAAQQITSLTSYSVVGTVSGINPSLTTQQSFNDASAVPGVEYLYRVVAVCTDNIASDGSIPMDGTAIKVKADPPTNVSGSFDTTSRQVKLSWVAPTSGAGAFYVTRQSVQNGAPSGPILNLGVVSGSPIGTTLNDPYVRTGQSYVYSVSDTDLLGHASVAAKSQIIGPIPPVASNSDSFSPGSSGQDSGSGSGSGTGGLGSKGKLDDPAIIAKFFTGTLPASIDSVYNKAYRLSQNTLAIVVTKAYFQNGNVNWGTASGDNGTWTSDTGQHLLMFDFVVKNVSAQNATIGLNDFTFKVTMSDGSVYTGNVSVMKDGLKDFRLMTYAADATIHLISAVPVPTNVNPTRFTITGSVGIPTEFDVAKNPISGG